MPKNNYQGYFDYAATTPVDPRVVKAMLPYFLKWFGNTMSLHSLGQASREALEQSRQKMAGFIGAKPTEILFTGSATESNNLALKGVIVTNRAQGRHVIISPIEHPCIMESAKWLERQGFRVTRLKVDRSGLVDPQDVQRAITKETVLVSVMHANNEIGTIEPIEQIGQVCQKAKVLFHTDASQSFGKIPINVSQMKVDLLTASSQKMYGPKGASFLYVKQGTPIEPILHGGGHERGLRASTVNLPAIVGFAKAAEICHREMKREGQRLIRLRDKLIKGVLTTVPNSRLNGHPQKRLPNNANFSFDFVEGESLVFQLDLAGFATSTGSACSSEKLEASHVLLAIGLKPEQAHGSLRISLGRWTKESEIKQFLKVLPNVIENLRKISPFNKV